MNEGSTELEVVPSPGARAFIIDSGKVTTGVFVPVTGRVGSGRSDDWIIAQWLFGRSAETTRAYRRDIDRFLCSVDRDLRQIGLQDLQDYQDSLAGMMPRSIARMMKSVRSLLTFAAKLGYITFNVGAALQPVKFRNDLAEKILPKGKILLIIESTRDPRDNALLQFLYDTGGRVSEACALRWADLREVDDTAIAALQGKGGKTLFDRLRPATYQKLLAIKPAECNQSTPVFRGQGRLTKMDQKSVWNIVRKSALAAGVDAPMSPHWFRHAHASHSLQAGAPITMVQHQLGHSSVATTGVYAHVEPGRSSSEFLEI